MDTTERENVISLLTCYREEWVYRDTDFVNTFWRFTYLSLIIGFFPNLLEKLNFHGAPILSFSPWVFSVAGILFSLFGLFISLNQLKRIEKLDDICYKLIEMLPRAYRIERIAQDKATKENAKNKIFRVRTNHLFCGVYVIVALLIGINAIMQ